MPISPRRTIRWAIGPYTESKRYAADVCDLAWADYVKQLLTWEEEHGLFARWLEAQRNTPGHGKARG